MPMKIGLQSYVARQPLVLNFEASLIGFLDLNTEGTSLPMRVYLRQAKFPHRKISETTEVQIGTKNR